MKNLFAFVFGLFLFFLPNAVQAQDVEPMPQEEIAEVPSLDPITEAEINDLLGENPLYIGETYLRGNKVSTKRYYSKRKETR